MNELCDRGSTSSLPGIKIRVKRRYHDDPRGDEQIQWCEARMEIVNRDPNRARALGSALTVEEALRDPQFKKTWWLIGQLRDLHSDEANAALDRYATQIEQRFPNTPAITSVPENQALRSMAGAIRKSLPPRPPER